MSKITRLLALTAATMCSVAYSDLSSHDVEGERIPNVEMTKWGSVKFGTMTASPDSLTNTLTGITKSLAAEKAARVEVESKIEGKADKFLLGEGLSVQDQVCKITIVPEAGKTFPYGTYFYASGTNTYLSINYYDANYKHIDAAVSDSNGISLAKDDNDILVVHSYDKNGGGDTYWQIAKVELADSNVISAVLPVQTTYNYAMPHDWRIMWTALDEPDSSTATENTDKVDTAGRTIRTTSTGIVKNNRAKLSIQLFDEVNIPNFTIEKWEVISGPGTIEGDILTATESGVVVVRATASNGEVRDCPVSMYQWKDQTSYTRYVADANTNRKRVNDWHLELLQTYRANPSTNYYYTTWNDPTAIKHWANPGDRFGGEYGSRFHPYQHVTCNSGGSASWWWSHAVVSKHVLLAAKHYGWNHSRILNGYSYINFDGKFSGKVQLKLIRYVPLDEWAAANGFEGSDAATADLAFFVVEGEIPDECLPYLATIDYLNATYGCDIGSTSGKIPVTRGINGAQIPSVSLNQANMVALRAQYTGLNWGYQASGPLELNTIYDDGVIRDTKFREDIYQYVRLGCWHSVVMGDSGHPTYLYDPSLTTGLTDPALDGAPLYRPILLSAYHTAGGGPAVPRYLKIIKAFVESVGDTLPYVLGNPDTQDTSSQVITANAIRAMGGEVDETSLTND